MICSPYVLLCKGFGSGAGQLLNKAGGSLTIWCGFRSAVACGPALSWLPELADEANDVVTFDSG